MKISNDFSGIKKKKVKQAAESVDRYKGNKVICVW